MVTQQPSLGSWAADGFFRSFFGGLFRGDPTDSILWDWKMWVGAIIMIIQMSVMSCFRENLKSVEGGQKYNVRQFLKWLEVGSMDLLFLSALQYYHKVGVTIMVAIALLYNLYWILDTVIRSKKMTESFTADDIYEDFKSPMCKVFTIFFGQTLIFAMYMYALVQNMDAETANYSYWISSLVAVQMTAMFGRGSDSQLGQAFRGDVWAPIVYKCCNVTMTNPEPDEFWSPPGRCNIFIRAGMSYIANAVMRDLVAYTVPLLLMHSESTMDFVKDSLAVMFITTLDSTNMGGKYTLTMHGNSDGPLSHENVETAPLV